MLNCFFIKEENETSNLLYKLEKTDLEFEWLIIQKQKKKKNISIKRNHFNQQ